jgi:Ca2+/Na+ antiporter
VFSSNLILLVLVPALAAFERRFPLRCDTVARNIPVYLAGSVAFSGLHVVGMVLLRKATYAMIGRHYELGPWFERWFYEYLMLKIWRKGTIK